MIINFAVPLVQKVYPCSGALLWLQIALQWPANLKHVLPFELQWVSEVSDCAEVASAMCIM